ncbi:heterokaryon incompatibility protein-domain-containing protein [Xylaria sp. FL1042]|nr:heterokaryon incompatibility protein-domain-containing protein [Xylaria sp. FL1042]
MNDPGPPHCPEFYHPLAPEFIRVFELEAGKFSDPIVGRLVPQAIDGEPYEAVSYVWGDTRNRHDINIDGATLSVTANLYGALTAFRHGLLSVRSSGSSSSDSSDPGPGTRPVRRQVRRLWADAVCINQRDLPERTSQVELMARIFAGARRVLAWLGWEEGEAGRRHLLAAIRFIHVFMENPEAGLRDARILLHYHDHDDVAGTAGPLALLSEDDRRRFEEQARKWEAVKVFFEIEYFHRTWIVQELGLAREAIMCTALKPVDGVPVDEDSGGEGAAEGKDWTLELDLVDWRLVGQFVTFLDYSAASLVTHLGLLAWVAHHILMVWEMKEDGTPNCDFLTAMHWTRILGVTDARDRVYSLLGHPLAVLDGDPVIKPDYTVTRGVTYTKLAANFIRKTKNLYVVNLVDHEDDPCVEARDWDPQDDGRMPSWVPDWHSINRTTPLEYPVAAAEAEDSEIRIDGEIEGAEGTSLPRLLVRGWVVDEISAVSRRMETTDFPVTHLTRERAKKNPFWLDRLWELVRPTDASTDHDVLAVLETLSLALPLGTRGEDEPVSTAGAHQTLEDHRRSFAAYVLEYHELWHDASEAGGIDDDSYLPACSLYDSLPAEAQAKLRRRAEGVTGEKFIECMTWSSMCRVVYQTTSRLVGMGSRVARPGDLVCRVKGSPVLMTLRRIEDSGAGSGTETGTDAVLISCAYIGPTVVPARIKKDVLDGAEFGEKAAHFRLI